jgi:hypothetical protein
MLEQGGVDAYAVRDVARDGDRLEPAVLAERAISLSRISLVNSCSRTVPVPDSNPGSRGAMWPAWTSTRSFVIARRSSA